MLLLLFVIIIVEVVCYYWYIINIELFVLIDITLFIIRIFALYHCAFLIQWLYDIAVPRPVWALDFDSIVRPMTPIQTYNGHGPKFHAAQRIGEQTIYINTHLVLSPGPCSTNPPRTRRKVFGYTIPYMHGSASRNITAEHTYWSGNQFQGHSHLSPLPPKHLLTINDIGPPIALTLKAIIISPLTIGYKYEKLKKEKGLEKLVKKLRIRGRRVNQNDRNTISMSLYDKNNPTQEIQAHFTNRL